MKQKIEFQGVSMLVAKPTKEQVRANVLAGQEILKKLAKILAKPGVSLDVPPDIPLYHADDSNPDFIIQDLNGKNRRGRFEDGKFIEVAA